MGRTAESRYCTNCRAELPRGADSCPACGVFAGDVFDGTWPPRRTRTGLWLTLLAVALLLAGAAAWLARNGVREETTPAPELPSTKVVAGRPGGSRLAAGAKVTEAQAVRLLRRRLVESKKIRNDCIALLGVRGGAAYTFIAHDRCAGVRLGRWRVDPRSGEASPLEPKR